MEVAYRTDFEIILKNSSVDKFPAVRTLEPQRLFVFGGGIIKLLFHGGKILILFERFFKRLKKLAH